MKRWLWLAFVALLQGAFLGFGAGALYVRPAGADNPYGCMPYNGSVPSYACATAYIETTTGNVWLKAPNRINPSGICAGNGRGLNGGTPLVTWQCDGTCSFPPGGKFVGGPTAGLFQIALRVPYLKSGALPVFVWNPEYARGGTGYVQVDTTTSDPLYNIIDFSLTVDNDSKILQRINEYGSTSVGTLDRPQPWFWFGTLTGGAFQHSSNIYDNNCVGCQYLPAPAAFLTAISWQEPNWPDCPAWGSAIWGVNPSALAVTPTCRENCPQVAE